MKSHLPPAPVYVAANEADITAPSEWNQASVAPQLMTVRPGDTVYAISRRTGVSPKAIIAENRLAPPYALNIGQTLRIPTAAQKVSNNLTAQPAPTQVSLSARVKAPISWNRAIRSIRYHARRARQ